jgi:hypothetical protein
MNAFIAPASAAVCQAKSGDRSVALLELYTSEGCSSCPPADRWMAGLRQRGFTSAQVIPIALHVDYWNDLGWVDRFSQPSFTQRQRDIAQRARSRVVYTPQFLLNGRDYRGWISGTLASDIDRINRTSPRADISLQLESTSTSVRANADVIVRRPDPVSQRPVALYLALYENELRTDVRAGENRGRALEHAFVARRLLGPWPIDATGRAHVKEAIAIDPVWRIDNLGVAAFVQEQHGTDVWQALALGLCPKKQNP